MSKIEKRAAYLEKKQQLIQMYYQELDTLNAEKSLLSSKIKKVKSKFEELIMLDGEDTAQLKMFDDIELIKEGLSS